MKALDPRQKRLLAGLLAVVLLIAAALLLPSIIKRHRAEPENRVGVIPEADLPEGDGSKTDSYRSGGIGAYWDSLEEQEANGAASRSEEPRVDSRRPASVGVEDLFGDCRNATPEPTPQPAPRRSGAGGSPARRSEPTPKQPQEEARQEAAPVQPRPQIKRSGAVSSLDEDITSELGNGFSTLDGTDRWVGGEQGHPYRCMFTRDEKVRTGQRITLRLLEDLVVGSVHIPRNTHLQGVVSVSDRMEVSITSLDMGGRILSLHFEAYDTDGAKGIYCSELSQTAKEATEQGIATTTSTLNSRLGRVARDAAAVGASIVRNKAGEATVSVPAGYTFYIIEENR